MEVYFSEISTRWVASILLGACLGWPANALAQSASLKPLSKDTAMTLHARGAFDAKTTPLLADDATRDANITRYALDKQYHGDLEATSKGEMLGAGDPAKGSAGYVAIE